MPRVTLLHYTTPPVVGGVEGVVARHAQLLAAAGLEVQVLTGRGGPIGRGVRLHRLPLLDSRHRRVIAVTRELEAGRVTGAFEALVSEIEANLRGALAGCEVCVVHNALTLHKNLALTAALHRLATRRLPARLVAWCHDLAWTNPQYTVDLHPGAPWSLLRTAIPGGTYVTVSRDRQRDLGVLLGKPEADINVIPNGVDPAAFLRLTPTGRWLAATLRLWEQQVVLLLPVRITRRKRIEYALHVVAEMVRREMAVRLLVSGPLGAHNPRNRGYLEELRTLRAGLGLDEQVVFCSDLSGRDGRRLRLSDRTMTDLYLLADALLLPSRQEGFGLPLLEAGLARLPAWTTALPPLREIGGDTIHTFDPEEPPAGVALRLLHALMEEEGYRLRRRVLTSYSWEGIMRERIIPLLNRLVAVGRP
ncbi:MAG TPA: glycosyltransferase family 4 protein [bacterium]|nr:glycosyltransferase family 4 protein [bacterium]